MYALKLNEPCVEVGGRVDLSFNRAASWQDIPTDIPGGKFSVLLCGDESAGPLFVLASLPPMTESGPLSPAHGHDSDTWRITVLGQSRMGRTVYSAGDFRFQRGGQPYGEDNFAWGPTGGQSAVMVADRRGFPTRPVSQDLAAQVAPVMQRYADEWGVVLPDPYPERPAVATVLGEPDKAGKVEGTFKDVSAWAAPFAGTRLALGCVGHPVVGPIVVLVRSEPGELAIPACSFDTEVVHLVIEGDCTVGGDLLSQGDLRLITAGNRCQPVVAGPDGLSHVMVISDRRALRGVPDIARDGAQTHADRWWAEVARQAEGLMNALSLSGAGN